MLTRVPYNINVLKSAQAEFGSSARKPITRGEGARFRLSMTALNRDFEGKGQTHVGQGQHFCQWCFRLSSGHRTERSCLLAQRRRSASLSHSGLRELEDRRRSPVPTLPPDAPA